MIEILFRRKMIREILNRYSNSFWHQLVPYIMEIGILYVSRNYNIAELSVEDYKYILEDLKNPNSQLAESKKAQGSNQITNENENENNRKEQVRRKNDYKRTRSSNYNRSKCFVARKPSNEWRKGDEYVFRENESLSNLKKIYQSSPDSHKSDEENRKQNTSYLNPNVYPVWWGSESNYCPENMRNYPDSNSEAESGISKPKEIYKPTKTEVFFPNNKTKSKPRSGKSHKHKYEEAYGRIDNEPLYQNIKYAESKIRPQIIYDKTMHNAVKEQEKRNPTPKEWKYQPDFNNNNRSRSATPIKDKNPNTNPPRINYMISYDKNLKPETIKEKSKEKTKNPTPPDSYKNSVRLASNNDENKLNEAHKYSTYNPSRNEYPPRNKQVNNANNEETNPDFNHMNNPSNRTYQEVSFKKEKASTMKNEDEELLSSYAPSERTKNIFQREYSKENYAYSSSNNQSSSVNNSGQNNNPQKTTYSGNPNNDHNPNRNFNMTKEYNQNMDNNQNNQNPYNNYNDSNNSSSNKNRHDTNYQDNTPHFSSKSLKEENKLNNNLNSGSNMNYGWDNKMPQNYNNNNFRNYNQQD